MLRIAFDIGGTFTDFVLEKSSGERSFFKLLSTPDAPSRAVMDGVHHLIESAEIVRSEIGTILHATTIATNAIIERKGSRTALLTTSGFRDVLLFGRQKRYEMFDLHLDKPKPLIERKDIFELDERVLFDGTIEKPLDETKVDAILLDLVAKGYTSIAVCFLHSYVKADHERLVARRVEALELDIVVSLSCDVSPKFREYERTSTTVANAYVKPVVKDYVTDLTEKLQGDGIAADLFIMQSNGGLVTPELASKTPIQIVESGPAAGVLMCASVGRQEGEPHVLTFDMGGTTAKLGAIDEGTPAILPSFEVDQVRYKPGSGLPLNIPSIELLEIGAGGGSIAAIDLNTLKIGPESAGANPGPICYGRGGTRPTVTDANLVLGYLNPAYFNAGAMSLDPKASERGIEEHVAKPLGITAEAAAWGIHALATANMERALRLVSVERGRNPRDYVLVGFGGAGPLHAVRLAMNVGIRKVIIPVGAGVGSAVGLLEADPRLDYSMTRVLKLDGDSAGSVDAIFEELLSRAKPDAARLGAQRTVEMRFAYLRYVGQGHEIRIMLPEAGHSDFLAEVRVRFSEAYRRIYGYDDLTLEIEGVDWHLAITSKNAKPKSAVPREKVEEVRGNAATSRFVYFPETDGYRECPVYDRYSLVRGQKISGPAIVEERESTTVVPPGCEVGVTRSGNLVVDILMESSDVSKAHVTH